MTTDQPAAADDPGPSGGRRRQVVRRFNLGEHGSGLRAGIISEPTQAQVPVPESTRAAILEMSTDSLVPDDVQLALREAVDVPLLPVSCWSVRRGMTGGRPRPAAADQLGSAPSRADPPERQSTDPR